MEQDDEMEKTELDNETNNPDTYVSCYPNSRRYSMANAKTSAVSQGYNNHAANDDDDDDEKKSSDKKQQDTKIDIPTSQPPQYSPAYDKNIDKKVKVSGNKLKAITFFLLAIFLLLISSLVDEETILDCEKEVKNFASNELCCVKLNKHVAVAKESRK